MTESERLSRTRARRIALAAQGFADPPHQPPTMRTLSRTVARTSVLQVDSVNVLQRAHYMPLYSRMGAYDTQLLHRAASGRRQRRLVEYWAHVQALMSVDLWPAMRPRREKHRAQRGKWGPVLDNDLPERLLAEIRDHGAATARDLAEDGPRATDHWGWNWSQERRALDFLFTTGDLCIAARNSQFECVYDVPERVLPDAVLTAPVPTPAEAARVLVERAARSHGVATSRCLADYFRMRLQPGGEHEGSVATAIAELVEEGTLIPAQVEGWSRPAFLHAEARRPRRIDARTLLSPFDPVVWERERAERLFEFHYRIEIYVPAPKRQYGYYVLPFLLGDAVVARVDLKADRRAGVLRVPGAFAEQAAPAETASELAEELLRLAQWLGLDDVEVGERGDLAAALAVETRSRLGVGVRTAGS